MDCGQILLLAPLHQQIHVKIDDLGKKKGKTSQDFKIFYIFFIYLIFLWGVGNCGPV